MVGVVSWHGLFCVLWLWWCCGVADCLLLVLGWLVGVVGCGWGWLGCVWLSWCVLLVRLVLFCCVLLAHGNALGVAP